MKKHLPAEAKQKAIEAIEQHGQSVTDVAKTLGVSRVIVYQWWDRLNKTKTLESLERRKNPKSGRQSKLCGKNAKSVIKMLLKPATAFGYDTDFWTTRRIAQVVKREMHISVSRMSVHRTLHKYRQSYKLPETRYYETDLKKQKEWKLEVVPQIKAIIQKYRAILYFEDESNISLTPVVAKTWDPLGGKVTRKITGNRGSVSAISAISPDGRLLFNVHANDKRYGAKDIVHFLSQMLIHHVRRHLVVVMDQAPCHRAKLVKGYVEKQKRLHVFYLPPRSPEFNPDEKVWSHLKNLELKSHQATNTKALKKITQSKLRKMSKDKRVLQGIYRRSEGASFFD